MTGQRLIAVVLGILGLLAIVAAILYFAEPAKSLPSVLPGHVSGLTAHRNKRGAAALVIGVVLLAAAGYASVANRQRPA